MSTQSTASYVPPYFGDFTKDAFGRERVSQPYTQWGSKLLGDNRAILWDDVEVSGGGTDSTYNINKSSVTLSVSDATAGRRVRQSKQRFDYQSAKSHQVFATTTFGTPVAGISRKVGYFDDKNGIFVDITDTDISIKRRSYTTGSAVDEVKQQAEWNLFRDLYLNPENSLIIEIDFEWLGVGSIRVGFINNGQPTYVLQWNHANSAAGVYMTTPNLPIRYEIENDGTGPAADLECICSSVSSEGGIELVGHTRELTTVPTHVDANDANTTYAVVGYKLKSTHLDNVVKVLSLSVINEQSGAFRWALLLNPTVADTFTYSDVANAPIQAAYGATANTVTGGYPIIGDLVPSGGAGGGAGSKSTYSNLLYPGSTVAGVPDEIVLCATPLSANADIQGTVNLAFL